MWTLSEVRRYTGSQQGDHEHDEKQTQEKRTKPELHDTAELPRKERTTTTWDERNRIYPTLGETTKLVSNLGDSHPLRFAWVATRLLFTKPTSQKKKLHNLYDAHPSRLVWVATRRFLILN